MKSVLFTSAPAEEIGEMGGGDIKTAPPPPP